MTLFIERKFFKINQLFFFVITSLSLLVAIGCLVYGLNLHGAKATEKFSQPTPSYNQLKADKAQEKAAAERRKTQQEARAAQTGESAAPVNPEAIPAEYLDVLNSIEKSVVSFANKANQKVPSDRLRFLVFKTADRYSPYFPVSSLLRQLDVEAKALDADADRIRALPQSAPDYITWAIFLENFFLQVDKDIDLQKMRIARERENAAEKNLLSKIVLYAAAAAFGVFIFFTMFLVILSMEKNTYILRQIQERLDAKQPEDNQE